MFFRNITHKCKTKLLTKCCIRVDPTFMSRSRPVPGTQSTGVSHVEIAVTRTRQSSRCLASRFLLINCSSGNPENGLLPVFSAKLETLDSQWHTPPTIYLCINKDTDCAGMSLPLNQ